MTFRLPILGLNDSNFPTTGQGLTYNTTQNQFEWRDVAILDVANVFTNTQKIAVPTATLEALILQTTDNDTTKNILEILPLNGVFPRLFNISADGRVGVGTLNSVGNQLVLGGTYTHNVILNAATTLQPSVASAQALRMTATIDPQVAMDNVWGVNANIFIGGNTGNNITALYSAFYKYTIKDAYSGTIDAAYGTFISIPTITSSGGPTINNNYGLFINDQTVGTNNWAIWTKIGKVRFGDQVEIIGSAAGDIQCIIKGAPSQTANLLELQESDGSIMLASGDGLGGSIFSGNQQLEDVDFVWAGDTEANLLRVDAGLDAIHQGDWDTNYVSVDKVGDMTFVGGAGLVFGHMYIPGVDIIVPIGDADPEEVKDDGTTSLDDGWAAGELNLVTFPAGGDEHYLTVTKPGKYDIVWGMSFMMDGPGANIEVHGGIMVDDAAVRNKGEAHRTIANNNDTGLMGGNAIIDCPNGTEKISLWVLNADNNVDITIEHGDVTITMIGGT
jgi:hypothetical protein